MSPNVWGNDPKGCDPALASGTHKEPTNRTLADLALLTNSATSGMRGNRVGWQMAGASDLGRVFLALVLAKGCAPAVYPNKLGALLRVCVCVCVCSQIDLTVSLALTDDAARRGAENVPT